MREPVQGFPAQHIDTVVFVATTGCRIGEVFATRWGDLGREDRRPVVRVRTAKTAAGLRTLPLTPEMARRLTKRRASATYAADADPIFPSATGTPMSVHNSRKRIFRPACVTAGLPRATPHQLRHGRASLMAEQGYSAAEIAAQLGHADRGVTALHWYVHPKLHAAPLAADAMVRKALRGGNAVATRQPNLTETG